MPPEEDVGSSVPEAPESSSVDSSPEQSSGIVSEGSPQAAPAEPQYGVPELWGAFKSLPQFSGQDDRAIAARLYESLQQEQAATRALQQYQAIIPAASDYLRDRESYMAWKAAQEQAQNAAPQRTVPQQEEPGWWNPPKVKDSYMQWMTKDEHGREVISPDAPLEARSALTERMAYRADFAKKFLENPEQTLGPMVEKVAVQRAQSIVQEQIHRMKEEDFVTRLETENKDWLYSQDGNVSPEGLACQKYIQDARQLGISGAQARWDYATRMVERDILLSNMRSSQQQQAQYQQPQQQAQPPVQQAPSPPDSAAQRNMDYLRTQAMRTSSQRTVGTTDARTPQKPQTFAEKLAANLQREGLV